MPLTIDLTPEIEARLRQQAAKHGLDASEYARTLIERELPPQEGEGQSLWQTATTEEWKRAFRAWLASHDDITAPVIPLEALRRENLYEERV